MTVTRHIYHGKIHYSPNRFLPVKQEALTVPGCQEAGADLDVVEAVAAAAAEGASSLTVMADRS